MTTTDYYKLLEIPRTANPAEVKQAYKKWALHFHPDKNPGCPVSEEKFKSIKKAYEVLSDTSSRRDYDNGYYNDNGCGGNNGNPNSQRWWSWSPAWSPPAACDQTERMKELSAIHEKLLKEYNTRVAEHNERRENFNLERSKDFYAQNKILSRDQERFEYELEREYHQIEKLRFEKEIAFCMLHKEYGHQVKVQEQQMEYFEGRLRRCERKIKFYQGFCDLYGGKGSSFDEDKEDEEGDDGDLFSRINATVQNLYNRFKF